MSDHCLIGKTITEMKIADDKLALLFRTTDGDVIARADADCCSSTWIEHVELPALGFPATVLGLDDLDLPDEDVEDDDDHCIRFYGFKITTDRGHIVIDYRNESNGYYGGDLCWPGDDFYGGVFGQQVSAEQWRDLP